MPKNARDIKGSIILVGLFVLAIGLLFGFSVVVSKFYLDVVKKEERTTTLIAEPSTWIIYGSILFLMAAGGMISYFMHTQHKKKSRITKLT
jgi:flagellar basal body-associated protein FliL